MRGTLEREKRKLDKKGDGSLKKEERRKIYEGKLEKRKGKSCRGKEKKSLYHEGTTDIRN